jgi:hypothetical protein
MQLNMQFETQAQAHCYARIEAWIEELFSDMPWERLDSPGFGLFMGSAWVEVHIYPWEEDGSLINVLSTVVRGANLTPDCLNFLLRENDQALFGAFSLNEEGDIQFAHTIVGSTCDPEELEASVIAVLETADEYDDLIVAQWGGQRALDRVP